MTETPAVFTIPPGVSFVDSLASGLLARSHGDPAALARMTVLLPTRRACRALQEAFLRVSDGAPLLLPRLRPIGDVDEDELALHGDPIGLEDGMDLPPAISELRRRLLLSRLILGGGPRLTGGVLLSADQAAALAGELARLLDQVQTQRLDFERLGDLVPDRYAAHWQVTLEFLRLLTDHWPAILAEQGAMDPAARRNGLLEAQLAAWRAAPPQTPVIAAGSTGSIPATADLLKLVASLPAGCVVLPGLDRITDDESWQQLGPTHPQAGLARLLEHMGLSRDQVVDWESGVQPHPASRHRAALLALALRPAETSHVWRRDLSLAPGLLDGIARMDCASPQEEAETIALLMREALEVPERTAALVTPDRALARRVAAELRRWEIDIDDSAGRPLAQTPPGSFLRLVVALVAGEAAPVPLLAALKHPLAAGGEDPATFRATVRRLECAVLRGPRPGVGFAGLRRALRGLPDTKERRRLDEWIKLLAAAAQPLMRLMARKSATLADLLGAHLGFAEALAASDVESGAERLWSGAAGEAAAAFIAELNECAAGFGAIDGHVYGALIDELMAGRVVRPTSGGHPRLAIWGPLEARLQHVDLLLLGGLNEGTWPPEAPSDPWMSRPMRAAFGLPPPEQKLGLSAHDFAQAVAAPEIVLTRSGRVEGVPTVPSRWLLRLDAVLAIAGLELATPSAGRLAGWRRALDAPAGPIVPIAPPAPRPPMALRPRALPVTQIETWMRNPYGIYARYILRLRRLDPLDAAPGAAERGTLIHAALERFVAAYPDGLPDDATARLTQIGAELFADDALARPVVRAFWWPRFERIADWFVAYERTRRAVASPVGIEAEGRLVLAAPGGDFTLTAKADRIDRLADGDLSILDYKTGSVPAKGEMTAGFSPQLPLEALIAERGGFPGLGAAPVAEIGFLRLNGGYVPGEAKIYNKDIADMIAAAEDGLGRLIAAFDDPATAYRAWPSARVAPAFDNYAHLARLREWANLRGDGNTSGDGA